MFNDKEKQQNMLQNATQKIVSGVGANIQANSIKAAMQNAN
jgi:hypothetical protein